MPEQARRHHVVSKFYLRYFANDNERVTTVMLPGDRTFPQSIGDASVQIDYYTVIDQAGQQSDAAEQALSLVEAAAAAAWREVAAGAWPLSDQHRQSVAAWVALQLLRGSSVRNRMSEMASHALLLEVILGGRARLREALSAAGEPVDDDTVNREWIGHFKNPVRAEARANHHMQHLANMLPRVTQSLLDRLWILTVFERKALATSDHPVHLVPYEEMMRMGRGTGIENAMVIHVPLTRRHSLAMYQPAAVPPQLAALGCDIRQPGVAATALYSNSCTLNSARRFLFHHPDDAPLAGFDLSEPREREVVVHAQLWGWIAEDDRQVLLDAGFGPDDLAALLEQ
ncbi:hypothetical protein DMC64_18560 [Amycolatopsis sp. WAC 04197]|uniref:DUF4238 domain-containing protein n=1 Tax=Amycolatopsis sp. WAC 04197 TaxID=2203199 RepID=UPI000F797B9E|nr:DUF4238 domain-containing protein [Amycolatopsis sp. WAC 04197]RSN44890.1 hypothetical protein DMC64_18560 [Amycolatopsis sp. WAC 04197]